MAGVVPHEAVFEESILGGNVIVAAFPSLPGHCRLDAQYASGHLARAEDPAGSVGEEDVLSLEVEPGSDRTPRHRAPEAGLKLSDALEGSDPDAGVIVHSWSHSGLLRPGQAGIASSRACSDRPSSKIATLRNSGTVPPRRHRVPYGASRGGQGRPVLPASILWV